MNILLEVFFHPVFFLRCSECLHHTDEENARHITKQEQQVEAVIPVDGSIAGFEKTDHISHQEKGPCDECNGKQYIRDQPYRAGWMDFRAFKINEVHRYEQGRRHQQDDDHVHISEPGNITYQSEQQPEAQQQQCDGHNEPEKSEEYRTEQPQVLAKLIFHACKLAKYPFGQKK